MVDSGGSTWTLVLLLSQRCHGPKTMTHWGKGLPFKKQLKHPTQPQFREWYLKGGEGERNATGSDGSDRVPFNLSRWTLVVANFILNTKHACPPTPLCFPLSSIRLLAAYPSVWFCSRQFLFTTVTKCLLIGWMDGFMDGWMDGWIM